MQRYSRSTRGRPLRALAACLPLAALLAVGGARAQEEAGRAADRVYRIPVTGVVELGLSPFIARSLDEAAEAGAVAAILDIDTPGGRVDAAQQIADALGDARIPVYAYVNRRALSAGALIALATDGIYMRPGSSLGAATPITGDGEKASEKMVSAMRSEFRALAEAAGLDPRVAEAMVDEDIAIEGLDAAGKLLTLSTADAVRVGYAQEAADWDALLARIGAEGAVVVDTRPNWAEAIVRFLTHPLVSPFLLSLGFLGLLIEIKTPTFGLAGLVGMSSLGLFFGSHLLVGLAGWEALILLGLGAILLLVEAFVIPGFGVAGIAGILAILASILLSLMGQMPTMGDMMVALQVMGMSALIVGFVGWQLIKRLPNDRRAHRLFLQESLTRELGYRSAPARDDLVGAEGVALTDLRPAGAARFGQESVDVVSSGGWVKAGTPVRIVQEEGYRRVVEPL